MQTIVVAYDATDVSRRALDRGGDIAEAFGAQLIVTSIAPVGHSSSLGGMDPTDPPERRERQLEEAKSHLAARGVQSETVVAIGNPDEAIVTVATEKGADLIVIGTRGLGRMARLLGQSVSDGVVKRAPCDVFLVRDED